MDALVQAKEAMEWAEDNSLEVDAAPWYFAKAQAYAAIAQVEQLKRIADALYTPSMLSEGRIHSVAYLLAGLQAT